MNMAKSVGFIGLGSMGSPLANNILAVGYSLRVYNRTESKVTEWMASLPAEWAKRVMKVCSPCDTLAESGGIVVTMVSNDDALESVICGEQGTLSSMGRGGVLLNMSTVSPAIADKMAELHKAKGADYVACPVFGRPPMVVAKKLIAVPAGAPQAVERIWPILESTTQKIVRGGEKPSNSSLLKLCGNYMILATIQAQAEAFTLAESAGIPRETAYELISGGTGVLSSLPVISGYGRMVATHDYEPVGFTAENGLKDARLVCDAADSGGVDMPIAKLVRARIGEVVAAGGGQRDWASFATLVAVGPGGGGGGTRLSEPQSAPSAGGQ